MLDSRVLEMSFTVTHTILATDYSYYNGKSVDTFFFIEK